MIIDYLESNGKWKRSDLATVGDRWELYVKTKGYTLYVSFYPTIIYRIIH